MLDDVEGARPPADPFRLFMNPDAVFDAIARRAPTAGRVVRPLDVPPGPRQEGERRADPIGAWYRKAEKKTPASPDIPEQVLQHPATPQEPDKDPGGIIEAQTQEQPEPQQKVPDGQDSYWEEILNLPYREARTAFRRGYFLIRLEQTHFNITACARAIELEPSYLPSLLLRLGVPAKALKWKMPLPEGAYGPAPAAQSPIWQEMLALPYHQARDAFERRYLMSGLERSGFSVTKLATVAGLGRGHLYQKLSGFGINASVLKKEYRKGGPSALIRKGIDREKIGITGPRDTLTGPYANLEIPAGADRVPIQLLWHFYEAQKARTGVGVNRLHRAVPRTGKFITLGYLNDLVQRKGGYSPKSVERQVVSAIFNVYAQIPGLKTPVTRDEDTSPERFNGERLLYVNVDLAMSQVRQAQGRRSCRGAWQDVRNRFARQYPDMDVHVLDPVIGWKGKAKNVPRRAVQLIMSLYPEDPQKPKLSA